MRAGFFGVWVLFILSAASMFSQANSSSAPFHVDEHKIQFLNRPANRLEMPVVSNAQQSFAAHIHVELLNQKDIVLSSADLDAVIAPVSHTLVIPWKAALPSDSVADLYWFRLRYTIIPPAESGFKLEQGIVQLSQITSDLFRIQVSTLKHPQRGSSFPVRVHILDARTSKTISGVEVLAHLETDNDEHKQPAMLQKGSTDAHGQVVFIFKIPSDSKDEPSIVISAQRGSRVNSKSVELDLRDRATATLSTDKPIYQPGQVLHMRALVFGPDNHALARAKIRFTISDEDSNDEFETEVNSSEFGVAQTDWRIPEKIRLGDYGISVRVEDERAAFARVRISRYELPQFTVNPSADKSFYLPGERPQVTVKADYLFAQPVKRGAVRIVRDNGRKWNSEKKEYGNDQEDVEQGQLGPTGKFVTKLDVNDDFDDLKKSDYLRYKDIRFAAYVTDLSTNRTEQKHFTVRLSKDPIHIYVVGRDHSAAAPLDYYVATALPDGTPASVNVSVSAIKPGNDGDFPADPLAGGRLPLAHFRTNQYGVGHFRAANPGTEYRNTRSYGTKIELLLEARSRLRRTVHTEQVWLDDTPYLRIIPAATLLRAGENVTADVESSLPDQEIFMDLLGDESVLGWQRLQLKHGHAHVEFVYDEKFRNRLTLVAYTLHSDENDRNPVASAEVLFPEPQDLGLAVKLGRTTYKPGESAAATFNVRSPDGRPTRSALGILIYDKAVAERVRSDQEFGRYGFYYGNERWDDYSSIAGVSFSDLLNRKLTAPVPPDLELLSQAVLATGYRYFELILESDELGTPAGVFRNIIHRELSVVETALNFSTWIANGEYPRSLSQLRELLARRGVDFDALRDPWGMPYRAQFSTSARENVIDIVSNGPDKIAGTADDFIASTSSWEYFAPTGHAIDEVTADYARETGSYIRDLASLAKELKSRRGLDLYTLRDPWGHPYFFDFDIDQANYRVRVVSPGPDGVLDSKEKHSFDDVQEWTSSVHYFQRETAALDMALADHFRNTGKFPRNEEELRPVLEKSGLSPESLLDPWGHPYHFSFSQASRYSDHVDISTYSVYQGEPQRRTTVTPVTQQLGYINVVSYGPNNDSKERFTVAEFNRVLTEQSSKDLVARQVPVTQTSSTGGTGAISGTVTDSSGAVVANARVIAIDAYSNQQYTTTSGPDGTYLLRNLPAGKYRIEVAAQGFQTSVVAGIPVISSNMTTVDVKLNVGTVSETIEVSAAPQVLETTTAMVATATKNAGVRIHVQQQAFTPRVRRYFPETLLWQPELITDSSGKAELKFAMADNITTWKMSVMASTINGQLGLAEKELRTFQPFFIDHEPPKILTQGDQIQLPIVLRNYLNRPQAVEVKLEQSPWFSLLSAPAQRIEVPAGQDATARFSISADHSIREGKERVTAANRETGDAVEHSIAVHPDGEDVSQTLATLLAGGQNSFNFEIPINAIPGSVDAELKIYPNIGAHVLDSLNALAMRPAGCAEQITSIAFASVLVLQYLHKAGQDNPETPGNRNAELAGRARKYVVDAYQQLIRLQASSGGFSYWLDNEPDNAVTAHVLDFLVQASQFIDVDSSVIQQAQKFLISGQQPEGGWLSRWHGTKPPVDVNLSALITRVLAETTTKIPNDAKAPQAGQAMVKAMKFLEDRIAEWNDAYVVGQYALAASMTARTEYIGKAQELLHQLAHNEGPGTYWNLEANTSPFYGWGRGGRLETTGLAVRALAHIPHEKENPDKQYLDRGLMYLLSNKDRYGIWYSTQATLNVLRGIVDALPVVAEPAHSAGPTEIWINGKIAATVQLPASRTFSGPLTTNISALLAPGSNKIEVRRQSDSSPLEAQVFSTHYIRWADSQATKNTGFKIGDTRALRLNVSFDHVESQMGKSIQCTVDAERIGFEGYGMMLAEIGLPPGADVDRESLQQAMGNSGVSEYDVLPDRVVVYLWPRAGGSKFNFTFKPRLAMNASAAPSILYDYYNPDAHATVAPARFVVH
ncbi:MAG TPA: alpha-2-macroglobulin family protein [Candidatus Angelobacter sp.]